MKRFKKDGGMDIALKAYAPFEEVVKSMELKAYHADRNNFVRDFFIAADLPLE